MNAKDIVRQTPYLRRYARALTGSQEQGDEFVRTALSALEDGRLELDPGLPTRTALYQIFHRVWRRQFNGHSIDAPGHAADRQLMRLSPEHRTALLLVMMEAFTIREVSHILGIALELALERYEAAETAMELQLATNVLIIEDEPIVAMDLDRLVTGLGHRVLGVAATRDEAVMMTRGQNLGLILADVRLADGSSGRQVAADLLRSFDAPVIFITAFPERLLTGERCEPAFLVTKPFQDEAVKTLIGQALFFHEPQPRNPSSAQQLA
jgi:CheY-like chemotaxis protein/DNA-directed RNA polymerase specialized sigma24 family protein